MTVVTFLSVSREILSRSIMGTISSLRFHALSLNFTETIK